MSFNIPQIVSVTSESLQAKIRSLLPSQQGFGADLQASNVIFPVVDLTAAAEGQDVPIDLSRALAFGSQTAFDASNSTVVLANSPGFYRIFGAISVTRDNASTITGSFTMSDGLSSKTIYKVSYNAGASGYGTAFPIDFEVFLSAGDSVSAVSSDSDITIAGSIRQIADVNGNVTNPSGFNPQ